MCCCRLLAGLHATANPEQRAPDRNTPGQQDLQKALQGAMQDAGLTDEGLFSHGFSQGLDAFLLKQVGPSTTHGSQACSGNYRVCTSPAWWLRLQACGKRLDDFRFKQWLVCSNDCLVAAPHVLSGCSWFSVVLYMAGLRAGCAVSFHRAAGTMVPGHG